MNITVIVDFSPAVFCDDLHDWEAIRTYSTNVGTITWIYQA
uniref:Uncharacterized protein n=1 Tax=Anguilla anguilla TaxID=7936 RepID=A0A0E9UVL2_ANGAN